MLKIAIKNPAPAGDGAATWGDYHFGRSLQRALESTGAEVTQHFWPDWADAGEEVILVLRGKRSYTPPQDKLAIMWVISHPSTVTIDEVDSYDLVFVAGETHRRMLEGSTKTPVITLRQCTDTALFHRDGEPQERDGVIFVANSRGILRDMVRWSMESNFRPKLIGRSWSSVGLKDWVVQDYIANDQLPALYRSSSLGFNDHWGDMSYFGYISNRIFDCLACGLPVLSDSFAELRELCGDGILYADDLGEFRAALDTHQHHYAELRNRTIRLWDRIGNEHTFAAAAARILTMVQGLPRRDRSSVTPADASILEVYRGAAERLQQRGLTRSPKVLHISGNDAVMKGLFHVSDGHYFSGGFGSGPWHVRVSEDMPGACDEQFDLIVADDLKSLNSTRINSIAHRLNVRGGILALRCAPREPRLALLEEQRMVVIGVLDDWTFLEWPAPTN